MLLNRSSSSNSNSNFHYNRHQQTPSHCPPNYQQQYFQRPSVGLVNPYSMPMDSGIGSGVQDRSRSTSSTSLNHEMKAKPVVAIVYLVGSPSTYSTATLGRMTQNLRSRSRRSSGSSLGDGHCRMNKSSSLGNNSNSQNYPYGSPLHSYVSSQDLFSSQVQGRRRSSSANSSQPLLLPRPGQDPYPGRFESPIGFDLKAETEQLMNRTQKLLVRGRESEKADVDEWVI